MFAAFGNNGTEKWRRLAGRSSPTCRVNLWKHGVAQFDSFKFLELVRWDLVSGLKSPPRIQQCAELFQMRVEALLRIVARGLGGDQKLPVRGFQKQQLTAELFRQTRGCFVAEPEAA